MDVSEREASRRAASMPEHVVEDVTCTACGCVCDDLRFRVRDNQIVELSPPCPLAQRWFDSLDPSWSLAARIRGREADYARALERAAELLHKAQAPLIYGLSRSSTEGQRAAVRLADHLGATIDTTASRCHAPSIMALQQVGESTCSLGEAQNRADLVIFWGADPVETHPRHLERYSAYKPGMFVPRGRQDRFLVVVDVKPTSTSEQADAFLRIEPKRDFEALWTLRCLVRGIEPCWPSNESVPSWLGDGSLDDWRQLAERMKSCRSGIVFFGLGLTQHASGHASVEALLRLVTDLNGFTRFYARRMRVPGDVAGADSVLCWQTGFPFSVNLARGYPRYNPGEYSASELLERGEVDVCLIVGSESVERLSADAQRRLGEIPCIVLDYPLRTPTLSAEVHFTTAVYGVHRMGTAYRMDETPLPLRAFLSSDLPSDGDVLQEILRRIPHPDAAEPQGAKTAI